MGYFSGVKMLQWLAPSFIPYLPPKFTIRVKQTFKSIMTTTRTWPSVSKILNDILLTEVMVERMDKINKEASNKKEPKSFQSMKNIS
jgi:hypothetical protein